MDQQVKIRGFRVEPGEIEAALLSHPDVSEAVVMLRQDSGDKRLAAYWCGAATAGELRAHLRELLPDYMVPSAFVSMEALPLNANGKIDRAALPVPAVATETEIAPRTPVEELIAGIWADLLGLEHCGVEENFFDLGGHSLLATQVISRVRKSFGVELPVRAAFEAPTVAGLAARVEAARGKGAAALPQLEPMATTGERDLSFAAGTDVVHRAVAARQPCLQHSPCASPRRCRSISIACVNAGGKSCDGTRCCAS